MNQKKEKKKLGLLVSKAGGCVMVCCLSLAMVHCSGRVNFPLMTHSSVHSFWFSFFSLFEVVNLVEPVYGLLSLGSLGSS